MLKRLYPLPARRQAGNSPSVAIGEEGEQHPVILYAIESEKQYPSFMKEGVVSFIRLIF